MEKPQLFISDDLPPETKEVITIGQKLLDNLIFFKAKADAGTLTLDDLDELRERASAIADELPVSNEPVEGFPPQTSDMAELEAYAQRRGEEDLKLLEESGGPAVQFKSLEQMMEVAKLPPMEIANFILDTAKEKQKNQTPPAEKKQATSATVPKLKVSGTFQGDLFIQHLKKLQGLLYNAKLSFFECQPSWQEAELFEEPLLIEAKAFEEFRQEGPMFLRAVLTGNVEDESEELCELKGEAAYCLATIETGSNAEMDFLIDTVSQEEKTQPVITQALKYGRNPELNTRLEMALLKAEDANQARWIKLLAYRRRVESQWWDRLLREGEPLVSGTILRAYTENGIKVERSALEALLNQEDHPDYEALLFTALLAGLPSARERCQNQFTDAADQVKDLPLFLACASNIYDYGFLGRSLQEKAARISAIKGLGIFGIKEAIPLLIDQFNPRITCLEDWHLQKAIADSLELITDAKLELSFPEIQEGPAGKEYEVEVTLGWAKQWFDWWLHHHGQFQDGVRYRRGKSFTLQSCIDEMANPIGSYWTRQYSYYELQIRSGFHVAPFFADWYVKDQLAAIEQWQRWYEKEQTRYPPTQWLYHGRGI